MSTKTRLARWIPRIAVVFAIFMAVGFVYTLKQWLGADTAPSKKMVQQITLLAPPPPPPPPKVEEPPPPEIEEKVEVPEQEPEPEPLPEQADTPPAEQLGLDTEGGAGSDAFGLAGNKGGRALLGGSGGSAEAWYKRMLGQELKALINDRDDLRKRAVANLKLKLWIDEGGHIQKVELLNSSGDKEWDRNLKSAFMSGRLQTQAPAGIEQPVRLNITSRS